NQEWSTAVLFRWMSSSVHSRSSDEDMPFSGREKPDSKGCIPDPARSRYFIRLDELTSTPYRITRRMPTPHAGPGIRKRTRRLLAYSDYPTPCDPNGVHASWPCPPARIGARYRNRAGESRQGDGFLAGGCPHSWSSMARSEDSSATVHHRCTDI